MGALLVLLGPTGSGKTELSLLIASKTGAPIISADSRQIYKDLVIGTAAPTSAQLAAATHYMVGTLQLEDYYSASMFESETLALLNQLFETHPVVICSGGSMMYIDALCNGIDEMPTVTVDVRNAVYSQYKNEGLAPLLEELQQSDPVHYAEVDRHNYKRVIHAVEICRMTGQPYSAFRRRNVDDRPFRIIKIGLTRPRDELCDRINRRVDQMMADGMLDEAKALYPFRHLNSLNTVGYKELFRHISGEWTLEQAVEKIKRNTRVYARKQMTWFRRDTTITWFHPDEKDAIFNFIEKKLHENQIS